MLEEPLLTPTTRPHRPAARARAVVRAAGPLLMLAAAACADQATTGPRLAERDARPALLAAQSTPPTGVECGCSRVGPYAAPALGKAIAVSANGSSPNGVYKLTTTTAGRTVTIRIKRGNTLIREFSGLPTTTSWGFSPDDHRFVYHYRSGASLGTQDVYVYNLAASGAPLVREFHATTTRSRIAFSPRGHHLLYARLTAATSTALTAVDAVTGATRFETAFTFQTPSGTATDSVGMATWGFSPDDGERTLVYTYLAGQAASWWSAVNLAAPPSAALVISHGGATNGSWSFSPCGDLLGVVQQPYPSQLSILLARTIDGQTVIGSPRTLAPGTVAFRSTLADHIVSLGGVDQPPPLAANTADDACQAAPTLDSVSLAPASVQGGGTSACTVTLSGPAPAGGLTVSLASANPGVATLPAYVIVPEGNTSASAIVQTSAVASATPVTISGSAGTITRTATLTVTVPVPGLLSISPTSLTFRTQQVGTYSLSEQVTLTNGGTTPVAISAIAVSGDFMQSHLCPIAPATLAVGASCPVFVLFAPTAPGTRTGLLTITSTAAGSPQSIPLTGTGWIPTPDLSLSTGSLSFGSVTLGTATSGRVIKVTSTGSAPLVISALAIGGTNPGDFAVVSDSCTGSTLSAGMSCTLAVGFEPLALGTRSATLTIVHNAPGGSSTVALSGAGVSSGGEIP